MGKPVVITLTVQANSLYGMYQPTQSEVDSKCSITDDNSGSSPNGGTIENFLSNVYINQNVKWLGITNDQGFTVSIDSIVYELKSNDVNFFNSGTIYGSGGKSGNANANIKNNPELDKKLDIYTINFSIYNNTGLSKSFHIDPKLAANP